jgi:hypothetical protein
MWDLWGTKWHWDRFFSEYFGFPPSVSFHWCSITRKRTKNNNNHHHLHHRVAQEASRLQCVRSVCCGALHHYKKTRVKICDLTWIELRTPYSRWGCNTLYTLTVEARYPERLHLYYHSLILNSVVLNDVCVCVCVCVCVFPIALWLRQMALWGNCPTPLSFNARTLVNAAETQGLCSRAACNWRWRLCDWSPTWGEISALTLSVCMLNP